VSRVGIKPVQIPDGVTVKVDGAVVSAKGPKGELAIGMPVGISAKVDGKTVVVARLDESQLTRSLHGLNRSLVANMLAGVAKGYAKDLDLEGVGYKAEMKGKHLILALGLSHPVDFEPPAGITVSVKGNSVTVSGADKQQVGDVAARIRLFRPPEPYKGKGMRYRGEHIRRKAGKTVA